jgi:hypothetical protein
VGERQLRDGEHGVLAPALLDDQSVQCLEGARGIPAETLGQVEAVQHVLAEEAGRA